VTESSGLARSTYDRSVLWTHNEAGDGPRLYAIGTDGGLRATVELQGARNVDWEDVSSGPGNTLWVGDIGDSGWSRPYVSVYRLTEPADLADRSVPATRYDLAFPDGARNAGALMVHPVTGRVFVVSHVKSGGAVYRAPAELSTTSVNVMTKVAAAPGGVTAASFVPGSDRFVLGDYSTVYSYSGLGATPVTAAKPSLVQSDSTEVARDGTTLYTGSEGSTSPVYRMPVPGVATSAPAPAPAPEPAPAPSTTTLRLATWDSLPTGPLSAASFNAETGGTNPTASNYDDSSIAADSRGTGKVYRLKLDAGSYRDYPAGNNGIVVWVPLARQVDNACLSYDIKFSAGFPWSLGGKLPGLQGTAPGVTPGAVTGGGNPGDKGWSGRLMWVGPKAYSWAGPTNMAVSYMYGPKQSSYYGDNVLWNKAFVADRWHAVKVCYVMNTVGKADGKLYAWMDGAQVVKVDNHVYRTRSDVHISHLNWSIFRGGGSIDWAASTAGHIDLDNVRITTG
jgi:hypothetical protein